VTDVFSVPITPELIEELERTRGPDLTFMLQDALERTRGPDLTFMLQDAHRPFYDPCKVYRIELSDPTLRISYSAGPIEIDRNKLH